MNPILLIFRFIIDCFTIKYIVHNLINIIIVYINILRPTTYALALCSLLCLFFRYTIVYFFMCLKKKKNVRYCLFLL